MRRFSTSLAIAVSMLLVASICSAQQTSTRSVPNLIRYGGVLKDAQGVALSSSTTVGVTFSIYKQQDGGAPVWMETQNVTSDASGQYSVLLGSTTATGLPSDLFSQEEQRWLGVQVQGQAEQSRVLLVSVPYAFKAHEAETLAGKSISDFVLAKDLSATNSAAGVDASSGSGSMQATAGNGNNKSASRLAILQGPTNFSGLTTDQIVKVTQSGTGAGVSASAASNAILGTATAATGTAFAIKGVATGTGGRGIFGYANSATGSTIGMEGAANSTSGVGLWGTATATSGPTVGVFSSVASPSGTAAVYNNVAGGKILSGQNNGAEKFSVDGSGNVNSVSGTYRIGGSSVLGIGAAADSNLFLGQGAGTSNVAGQGQRNTFTGAVAGTSNTTGYDNSFLGFQAGASTTTGIRNTFLGENAGVNNTSGMRNTFLGQNTGFSSTTGSDNLFVGVDAGFYNTTGMTNTAVGPYAGEFTTTGSANTSLGYLAGFNNTTGSSNLFLGDAAGYNVTTGSSDIYLTNGGPSASESYTLRIGFPYTTNPSVCGTQPACGINAAYIPGIYGNSPSGALPVVVNANGQLGTSSSGGSGVTSWNGRTGAVVPVTGDYSFSMISGMLSPSQLPAGSSNYIQNGTSQQSSASFNIDGAGTLGGTLIANAVNSETDYQIMGRPILSSVGDFNTFLGFVTGEHITSGYGNTFLGDGAGSANTTGWNNIFIGWNTGLYNVAGKNNVYIGSGNPPNDENATLRIGQVTGNNQIVATYLAGVYNVATSGGVPVYINAFGQLGTQTSSRRFKEQIADMGDGSSRLFQLRPVTFFYKPQYDDGSHTLQYGLIAEEVAKVYPDLVAYDRDGAPYTVKYQYLAPMLLNELQKQHTVVATQQDVIKTQQEQIQSQGQQIADLQQRLSRLESLIDKK